MDIEPSSSTRAATQRCTAALQALANNSWFVQETLADQQRQKGTDGGDASSAPAVITYPASCRAAFLPVGTLPKGVLPPHASLLLPCSFSSSTPAQSESSGSYTKDTALQLTSVKLKERHQLRLGDLPTGARSVLAWRAKEEIETKKGNGAAEAAVGGGRSTTATTATTNSADNVCQLLVRGLNKFVDADDVGLEWLSCLDRPRASPCSSSTSSTQGGAAAAAAECGIVISHASPDHTYRVRSVAVQRKLGGFIVGLFSFDGVTVEVMTKHSLEGVHVGWARGILERQLLKREKKAMGSAGEVEEEEEGDNAADRDAGVALLAQREAALAAYLADHRLILMGECVDLVNDDTHPMTEDKDAFDQQIVVFAAQRRDSVCEVALPCSVAEGIAKQFGLCFAPQEVAHFSSSCSDASPPVSTSPLAAPILAAIARCNDWTVAHEGYVVVIEMEKASASSMAKEEEEASGDASAKSDSPHIDDNCFIRPLRIKLKTVQYKCARLVRSYLQGEMAPVHTQLEAQPALFQGFVAWYLKGCGAKRCGGNDDHDGAPSADEHYRRALRAARKGASVVGQQQQPQRQSGQWRAVFERFCSSVDPQVLSSLVAATRTQLMPPPRAALALSASHGSLPPPLTVIIMCGVPGSGKSTASELLKETLTGGGGATAATTATAEDGHNGDPRNTTATAEGGYDHNGATTSPTTRRIRYLVECIERDALVASAHEAELAFGRSANRTIRFAQRRAHRQLEHLIKARSMTLLAEAATTSHNTSTTMGIDGNGGRESSSELVRSVLVLDACNATKASRSHWRSLLPSRHPSTVSVVTAYFDTPLEVAAMRALMREGHKTLSNEDPMAVTNAVYKISGVMEVPMMGDNSSGNTTSGGSSVPPASDDVIVISGASDDGCPQDSVDAIMRGAGLTTTTTIAMDANGAAHQSPPAAGSGVPLLGPMECDRRHLPCCWRGGAGDEADANASFSVVGIGTAATSFDALSQQFGDSLVALNIAAGGDGTGGAVAGSAKKGKQHYDGRSNNKPMLCAVGAFDAMAFARLQERAVQILSEVSGLSSSSTSAATVDATPAFKVTAGHTRWVKALLDARSNSTAGCKDKEALRRQKQAMAATRGGGRKNLKQPQLLAVGEGEEGGAGCGADTTIEETSKSGAMEDNGNDNSATIAAATPRDVLQHLSAMLHRKMCLTPAAVGHCTLVYAAAPPLTSVAAVVDSTPSSSIHGVRASLMGAYFEQYVEDHNMCLPPNPSQHENPEEGDANNNDNEAEGESAVAAVPSAPLRREAPTARLVIDAIIADQQCITMRVRQCCVAAAAVNGGADDDASEDDVGQLGIVVSSSSSAAAASPPSSSCVIATNGVTIRFADVTNDDDDDGASSPPHSTPTPPLPPSQFSVEQTTLHVTVALREGTDPFHAASLCASVNTAAATAVVAANNDEMPSTDATTTAVGLSAVGDATGMAELRRKVAAKRPREEAHEEKNGSASSVAIVEDATSGERRKMNAAVGGEESATTRAAVKCRNFVCIELSEPIALVGTITVRK